jgi:hypothetical protein
MFDEELAMHLIGRRVSILALDPAFTNFYRRCKWAIRTILIEHPGFPYVENMISQLHAHLERLAWGPLGHNMQDTANFQLATCQFVCTLNIYEYGYRRWWYSDFPPHEQWWTDHPYYCKTQRGTMDYFDMVEDGETDGHHMPEPVHPAQGQRGIIPLTPVPGAP